MTDKEIELLEKMLEAIDTLVYELNLELTPHRKMIRKLSECGDLLSEIKKSKEQSSTNKQYIHPDTKQQDQIFLGTILAINFLSLLGRLAVTAQNHSLMFVANRLLGHPTILKHNIVLSVIRQCYQRNDQLVAQPTRVWNIILNGVQQSYRLACGKI